MAYAAQVIRVMVASPSDVKRERQIIENAVHGWNTVNSAARGLVLLPVLWETHSSPSMRARPQEVINDQLLKDCDLLVAAFWTRIGTPTGTAVSGTVEEIEEHLEARKPAMIYFSQAPVAPANLDTEQYRAVSAFKESCKGRGLIHQYEAVETFQEIFTVHLALTMRREFPSVGRPEAHALRPDVLESADDGLTVVVQSDKGPESQDDRALKRLANRLSSAAREWLNLMKKDHSGMLLAVDTFGGFSISIGPHAPVDNARGREEAEARETLRQLVENDLIVDRGYQNEVFSLTALGYQVADHLETA